MEPTKRKYKKRKQGYSISVKYYLRPNKGGLLGTFIDLMGGGGLTLYIRVSFLSQTVQMRSRTNLSIPEKDFDEYMKSPKMAKVVQNETASIKYSIKELKPDTIEKFAISQWSGYYSADNIKLTECIEEVATHETRCALSTTFDLSGFDPDALLTHTSNMTLVNMLSSFGVQPATKVCEQYQPLIDVLSKIESTQADAVYLWDWKSGVLRDIIKRKYGKESNNWLSLFDRAISNYQVIRHLELPG